jgi:hypothetical protein
MAPVFSWPLARVALALTLLTQQVPPDAPTVAAEAPPALPPPGGAQVPALVDPRLVHRPRLVPLISGAVVFGVSYAVAAFVGLAGIMVCIDNDDSDCGSQAKFLFIPLAGPVLATVNDESGDFTGFGWPTFAAASLVQLAGAALLIYGAVGHDVPRKRPRPRATELGFAPVASPGALGLGFNGTW